MRVALVQRMAVDNVGLFGMRKANVKCSTNNDAKLGLQLGTLPAANAIHWSFAALEERCLLGAVWGLLLSNNCQPKVYSTAGDAHWTPALAFS